MKWLTLYACILQAYIELQVIENLILPISHTGFYLNA